MLSERIRFALIRGRPLLQQEPKTRTDVDIGIRSLLVMERKVEGFPAK